MKLKNIIPWFCVALYIEGLKRERTGSEHNDLILEYFSLKIHQGSVTILTRLFTLKILQNNFKLYIHRDKVYIYLIQRNERKGVTWKTYFGCLCHSKKSGKENN